MRIVHYLNQFFAGLGGEEHAGTPLEVHDGAIGPGKLFQQLLGGDAQVVTTLVCGDNYAVENQKTVVADALNKIRDAQAELFVAGPCFLAGRYGMAAGALCAAVQAKLGIPVVTGMAQENPGVDLYRETLYIIDSGDNAAKMRDVLVRMAALALKLARKEAIGRPKDEGYIARGLIRDQLVYSDSGGTAGRYGFGESDRRAIRIRNDGDGVCANPDAAGGKRSPQSESDADYGRRLGAEGQPGQNSGLGGDAMGVV